MRKNQPLINTDDDIITKIGTILSINRTTKLAIVELEDETILTSVEFFYHCMPDDVENGYQAFAVDDKVLVAEKKYIIGFADLKPRPCERVYPIQLLTFDGTVENINSRAFSVIVDEGCNFELEELTRKLSDPCIQHLSQCRYKCGSGETQKIVSLMHYDSFSFESFCAVIRIVNHKGSADFVLKEFFSTLLMSPDKVYFYGSLSADLETLYTSFYADNWGIIPPTQRYLSYNKYKLVDVGDIKEWHLEKQGISPIGMPFRDNAIDRMGRCGCWHYDDEFTAYDEDSGVNCFVVSEGWRKHGTLNEAKYKTFDIETETFIESEKVLGLHLNPVTEEFVTCKSLPGTNCFYTLANGAPNYFILSIFGCHCTHCPAPYGWHIATHDRWVDYKYFYGGWSREYTLFSGLETYPPLWDTFFYDGLKQHKTTTIQLVGNCPSFVPKRNATCDGTASSFDGGEMRSLSIPFTSCVYAGHVKVGTEIIQTGWTISGPGYISGVPCNDRNPVTVFSPHLSPCGNVESETQDVNINDMELLSPFEMTLQAGDQIGNTFISYDEETDSLVRGVHYKLLDEIWRWKIWARFPGCTDKDITIKLESLLSSEHFFNIEAIIFT